MPADTDTTTPEVAEDLARRIRERMETIKSRKESERFRRVKGSYLFDVEGVGAWQVAVDGGRLSVTEGATTGDCIVRCEPGIFLKVAEGEQNLLTAYMQGRLEIEGDMALAQWWRARRHPERRHQPVRQRRPAVRHRPVHLRRPARDPVLDRRLHRRPAGVVAGSSTSAARRRCPRG